MNYQERLLRAIPGGSHTYSRGFDQFPENAPQILNSGKGVSIFDPDSNQFLDYGMGLRAVNIGYSEESIDAAAIRAIKLGNNLTRPSVLELEAAELFIDLIDSVEMVKFTKNGSSAVSAAVKLARAYTGREMIAACGDHPFFSFDDWFIVSTPVSRGIPINNLEKIKKFNYNDIKSLEELIDQHPNQIACVVLEPATFSCPIKVENNSQCCETRTCISGNVKPPQNFLKEVQELCKKNGIVFILDEMITGFRWDIKGAQNYYGVDPDLSTFGKAMANGYSLACVAGKREIMQLGAIEKKGTERVFLLSTTHGAEMSSLGAFIETVRFMKENRVIEHMWSFGKKLIELIDRSASENGISDYVKGFGIACSPYYETLNSQKENSLEFRTLFSQEMIKNGVLIPWISVAYRHGEEELRQTYDALSATFKIYARALEEGVENYLIGDSIKPVFRKYN